jgi:ATP-dependent Lon protease
MLKKVLDSDHYGLEDVKERILEYLAVSSVLSMILKKEQERFFV